MGEGEEKDSCSRVTERLQRMWTSSGVSMVARRDTLKMGASSSALPPPLPATDEGEEEDLARLTREEQAAAPDAGEGEE